MSLLQFSVTVMAVETRAKDIEELKEQLLKEDALKKQERDMKVIKRNQVGSLISGRRGICSRPCTFGAPAFCHTNLQIYITVKWCYKVYNNIYRNDTRL